MPSKISKENLNFCNSSSVCTQVISVHTKSKITWTCVMCTNQEINAWSYSTTRVGLTISKTQYGSRPQSHTRAAWQMPGISFILCLGHNYPHPFQLSYEHFTSITLIHLSRKSENLKSFQISDQHNYTHTHTLPTHLRNSHSLKANWA